MFRLSDHHSVIKIYRAGMVQSQTVEWAEESPSLETHFVSTLKIIKATKSSSSSTSSSRSFGRRRRQRLMGGGHWPPGQHQSNFPPSSFLSFSFVLFLFFVFCFVYLSHFITISFSLVQCVCVYIGFRVDSFGPLLVPLLRASLIGAIYLYINI